MVYLKVLQISHYELTLCSKENNFLKFLKFQQYSQFGIHFGHCSRYMLSGSGMAAKINSKLHFTVTAHSCKPAWVSDKLALITTLMLDVSAV